MFFKRRKIRSFDYQPRYYKPEEDKDEKETERRKRKLGLRTARRRKKISWVTWGFYFILLLGLIYIYLKLSNTI
ncbi:MAG: hypothetical protein JW866_02585 [Ignavibacteriales bacterium]|nr:hypothetical protein [Ignavibacteriales bacterium]